MALHLQHLFINLNIVRLPFHDQGIIVRYKYLEVPSLHDYILPSIRHFFEDLQVADHSSPLFLNVQPPVVRVHRQPGRLIC